MIARIERNFNSDKCGEKTQLGSLAPVGSEQTGKGGNHGAGDPQDGREGRNQAVRKDDYGVCKHSACGHQHSPFLRGPV